MGRLKPGLSLDQANAEMIGLARRLAHDYPATNGTLTSANIAATLAQSYNLNVLLIDGDIRRPSLHRVFGLSNSAGLADAL